MKIHNCHTHIFTNNHAPDGFLPFGLARLLAKSSFTRAAGRFINTLTRDNAQNIFDRYVAFLNLGNFSSQDEIFNFLTRQYPKGTVFIVLSLDMEYMGAGRCPIPFKMQLEELAEIKLHRGDTFRPFICADPRRPGITSLVQQYIEEKGFAGVKIYPALGFYPFDERLNGVYTYCQKHNLPVIAHCARKGIYFRYPITRDMLRHPITGEPLKRRGNQSFSDEFTDPNNYTYLLERFPNLKLSLAHLGGPIEWDAYLATRWDDTRPDSWLKVIIELIRNENFPNVYGDIAYTVYDQKMMNLLKALLGDSGLRSKILLGTDFYIAEIGISERAYSINLRGGISHKDYIQIAETNAVRFLTSH